MLPLSVLLVCEVHLEDIARGVLASDLPAHPLALLGQHLLLSPPTTPDLPTLEPFQIDQHVLLVQLVVVLLGQFLALLGLEIHVFGPVLVLLRRLPQKPVVFLQQVVLLDGFGCRSFPPLSHTIIN